MGCDRVDLVACRRHGVRVVNVPAYSPTAIAEHALAMTLCLNRHLVKAHNRVREGNFTLSGLVGWNLAGKTAGILGTGKIGRELARKLKVGVCGMCVCDCSYVWRVRASAECVRTRISLMKKSTVSTDIKSGRWKSVNDIHFFFFPPHFHNSSSHAASSSLLTV